MLDDILKSMGQQVSERLANPLLGSFAIAWCLWNYKFLVILFSSATITQTFQLIDKFAFPDMAAIATSGVFLPALTAAVYIFVYPYPAKFVYGFRLRRQTEVNALRQTIENETLLSVEESRRIRAELVAINSRHREEVDQLNAELTELRSALKAASKDPQQSTPEQNTKIEPEIVSPSQLLLLKLINEGGGKLTEGSIVSASNAPKVKTVFDLGELLEKDLIEKNYDQSARDFTYQFTHEGRRLVVSAMDSAPLKGG